MWACFAPRAQVVVMAGSRCHALACDAQRRGRHRGLSWRDRLSMVNRLTVAACRLSRAHWLFPLLRALFLSDYCAIAVRGSVRRNWMTPIHAVLSCTTWY